jgi:radical SAM protein with 4Fe4S-binding SPASM domain
MRPSLHPSFDLVLRRRRAYLHRREDDQPVAGLSPLEAVTVGLMDGERTSEELVGLLGGAGRPDAAPVVAGLLGRLGPLLVDGIPRESAHELESLARALPVDPDEGLRRLPGPRILHWWVTSYCPKRCVYCFANPILGGRAKDAALTRPALRKVFVEAASLGAVRLLVAGAEPLLRPDLPEVLGDAVEAGLLPLITTKHRIDRALAERFAAAGLRHMSLSLDTVNLAESRKLIGLANYPEHVRGSIACLKQAGIEFSLQTVLTRFNPDALLPVVQFASEHGARVVQAVPYEPVRAPIGPYGNEELAAARSRDDIRQEIERLGGMFGGVKLELFEELGTGSRDAYQCDIGMTKLFFLPDGVVHRCYKLTDDSRLRGRDLRTTSVAAAWHDPGFRPVISPPRQAYSGTACASCQRFSNCHDDGRCLYQAMVSHGRYEAPDRNCGGPHLIPLGVLR